jgi:hypothetical protein
MATIVCASCGTVNDAKNLFCQACGKSLNAAAPAASDKTVVASRKAVETPPAPVAAPVAPPPPTPAAPVMPPPPPAYVPPAPMGTPISSLGLRSDGWSDVLEDAAGLEETVKEAFVKEVKAAGLPALAVGESLLTNGKATRKYLVLYNGNGANVVVRFAAYGKDLLTSWDLYTKRKFNWLTIGLLGGIVFLLTLIYQVLGHWGLFYNGLFAFLQVFLSLLLVPTLALMLVGKLIKDDWLGLFVDDLDEFAADDAIALTSLVDSALSRAVESAQAEKPKGKK